MPDINSIHKKIVKIPDFQDVSKEFINIQTENLLKNSRIRDKANRGNPSFTSNEVTIEIPIHCDSHTIPHVQLPSPKYSLQIPNTSPINSTIPEMQQIINNMVNEFSFIEVTSLDLSPTLSSEDKL